MTIPVILNDPRAKLTSKVYASRKGLVDVTKVDDELDMRAVKITVAPGFGETDYLVRVTQKGTRTVATLLHGTMPQWAGFPDAWKDWVHNLDVQLSASSFIWQQVVKNPELQAQAASSFEVAAKPDASPADRKRAWAEVARLLKLDEKDIAGTGSRTAVLAMPIRIAQKLSKGRPAAEQWKPPVARPQFADPETSGRVLVAAHPMPAANAS